MITLYANPNSTCSRKVLTTLHEKGAEYELRVIDLAKREQKSPEHVARQPFGVVPVLVHDGFQLYESRAIIRYLDRALGGASLTPGDAHAFARMEQLISIEQSYFSGPALQLYYQKLRNPRAGLPTDPAIIEESRAKLAHAAGVVDGFLARSRHLAGESFSLADICFMPYVAMLHATKDDDLVHARPAFARWWKDVSARPAWQKTLSLARA